MLASLLADMKSLTVMVVVVAVAVIVKEWVSLRKARLRENGKNTRFTTALDGSSPVQRPAIIDALNGEKPPPEEPKAEDTPGKGSFLTWLLRLWRKPPESKD
jgi:hypothetical protein